jgi:hypothetical protein
LPNGGQVAPIATQLHATGLRGREGVLGPLRDHLPLVLGDGGKDVDREPVGLGEVDGGELDAALHQVRDERHVAGQPIQFRDDQGRTVEAAEAEGLGELRAVVALAALDLHDFSREAPVAPVEVGAHRLLLGLQAEAAASLLLSRDAVVGDVPTLSH